MSANNNNGARVPGADALANRQQAHYDKMAAAQGLMNLRPPGQGGRKMRSHRSKSSRKMRQHRRKSLRTRRGRRSH